MRLKTKDLKEYKLKILAKQDWKCAICDIDLILDVKANPTNLHCDHCHKTGFIRGTLCRRCNTLLGKIENWYNRLTPKKQNSRDEFIDMLYGISCYAGKKPYDVLHPSFKTDEEKRLARNKKAKLKRKKLKVRK